MEEKELKYKFLDLLYKHTYVLPANSIKKLILKYDKAQTLIKKQKLYNMLLEFEKLGVATMKDLKDIKKLMTRKLSEPVYEKEIKIIKKKEDENKEEKNISDDDLKLKYIKSALSMLNRFKTDEKYDTKIKIDYNVGYNDINDDDLKNLNKIFNNYSVGSYEKNINLFNDVNINKAIEILNILKKNVKTLNMFNYTIGKYERKKIYIGEGIKKNKKNNNSYLSLLKSMI
jgi:hypothetical protein